MNNKIAKITSIVALAGVAVFGLSACTTSSEESKESSKVETSEVATSTPVETPQVLSPLTKSLDELKDAQLTAVVGQGVNINVPEADVANYTATSSDPAVAVFTPGGVQGSAVTNPGLTALAAGQTTITLTNTVTNAVTTFTLTVA